MTPEEIGAYIMFLCWQWDEMGAVPDDAKAFAAYTGWQKRPAERLLERIIGIGKVKRDENGLYNSRMLSEIEQYVTRAKAAQDREMRKRLARVADEIAQTFPEVSPKVSENFDNVSPKLSEKDSKINDGATSATPLPEPEPEPYKENMRIQASPNGASAGEEKPPNRAKPKPKPTEQQWTEFWDAYPLRKGKAKARAKFFALTPDDADRAIDGARAYAAECATKGTEPQFRKWAEGWLNARRFEDLSDHKSQEPTEIIEGKAWGWWRGSMEAKLRALSADRWRGALDAARPNGVWPWWKLGAPPGHPECLVHPTVLEERNLVEVYKGSVHHGH